MKHSVFLTLAALILPVALDAQSAGNGVGTVTLTSPGHKTSTITIAPHPACPVSMQAKQGSGAGLVAVRRQQGQPDNNSILNNKPAQHIHLILGKMSGADLQQIASATVTARGLSARGRLDGTPALLGSPTADLHRTFDVRFTSEDDGSVYADLDLPGFTSVQSVRIDSIALKDGSKWTFDARQGCEVTPDPLMLVAAQ